jgi:hypothetical protein
LAIKEALIAGGFKLNKPMRTLDDLADAIALELAR